MSTFAKSDPKQSELSPQSSQAIPATNELTISEVESCDTHRLFDWIQRNLKNQLDDKDKEAFINSKIDGEAFLDLAGNRDYFRSFGLSPGAGQKLAQLAKNLTELVKNPICRNSKHHRLHYPNHTTAS